ncbi:hypothetical protein TL5118_01938 [Thalassovita autumnalis]|uniref:Uncharacterized protein n=1 Tax=Thalassovita autumnalis TaxID=2072972 RepID=A0A0N7LVP4_9RHOB|nr:hypothetical protein TL5118_01938 [Thalassovita autumnalis]CUH71541.1 hypothetical protein TL5120_01330 [Thalassovita autumnalis]
MKMTKSTLVAGLLAGTMLSTTAFAAGTLR